MWTKAYTSLFCSVKFLNFPLLFASYFILDLREILTKSAKLNGRFNTVKLKCLVGI